MKSFLMSVIFANGWGPLFVGTLMHCRSNLSWIKRPVFLSEPANHKQHFNKVLVRVSCTVICTHLFQICLERIFFSFKI